MFLWFGGQQAMAKRNGDPKGKRKAAACLLLALTLSCASQSDADENVIDGGQDGAIDTGVPDTKDGGDGDNGIHEVAHDRVGVFLPWDRADDAKSLGISMVRAGTLRFEDDLDQRMKTFFIVVPVSGAGCGVWHQSKRRNLGE